MVNGVRVQIKLALSRKMLSLVSTCGEKVDRWFLLGSLYDFLYAKVNQSVQNYTTFPILVLDTGGVERARCMLCCCFGVRDGVLEVGRQKISIAALSGLGVSVL